MLKNLSLAAITTLLASAAIAQDDPPPSGECSGGLCGTPEQSGGGCGCGCGCSILIAFTDQGDTYQYADDFDNDGIEDDFDNCPFAFNGTQVDADGDGHGDGCDNCPISANAGLSDVDADGFGDLCDDDADADISFNPDDNCILVPNPGQADSDIDGFGNACDDDDDNDGCGDALDNCPLLTNVDCADSGVIKPNECFSDEDADDIEDSLDNCPGKPNQDQGDFDVDAKGDACDSDLDNDAIANLFDNCLNIPNGGQKDIDRDGRGDDCDPFRCFVITSEASCLDPAGPFAVHAGKSIATETGKDPLLHIFANRESRAIRYTWTVTETPEDGEDAYSITNPQGAVSISESVEYVYENDREVRFSTRIPGRYKLRLNAELAHPEDDDYDVKTAVSEVEIDVAGEPLAEGCASTTASLPAIGALAGLLVAVRRRRRAV